MSCTILYVDPTEILASQERKRFIVSNVRSCRSSYQALVLRFLFSGSRYPRLTLFLGDWRWSSTSDVEVRLAMQVADIKLLNDTLVRNFSIWHHSFTDFTLLLHHRFPFFPCFTSAFIALYPDVPRKYFLWWTVSSK